MPRAAAGLFLSLVFLSGAWAQTPTGRISGIVLDIVSGEPTGSEHVVEAANVATGRTRRVTASVDGRFHFVGLPPGTYELQAAPGALRNFPVSFRLGAGSWLRVEVFVQTDLAVLVEYFVNEELQLLEPDNAAVGTVIDQQRIRDLPLNERDFLRLALLANGAAPAAQGSELSRQNDSGLHINGAREASNNFLLDGIDNNDRYLNRLGLTPPLDFVREFRLHSANYQAEYGRSGGAQVNVVSRSGGNQFHGSAYNYLRNDALDARNFFDDPLGGIPQFQRNQFGGWLSGPVAENRAFFVGGYEGTRLSDGVTKRARVPSLAARNGDLSTAAGAVFDPFSGAPFANNVIPASRIDAVSRQMNDFWPTPNLGDPTQNFVSSPTGDGERDSAYGKGDFIPTDSDTLNLRYNFVDDDLFEPFSEGTTNVPGFGSTVEDRAHNVMAGWTHVFGPSVVTETRIGWNRLNRIVEHENVGRDFAREFGIAGISSAPELAGFPDVDIAGFDSLGDNTAQPIRRRDSTLHLSSALTAVRGRHTFKFGGEYRHFSSDGFQALFARGQINFLGGVSQNPFGDYLLGLPNFAIQTVVDNPFRMRTWAANAFVQDDWRITPHLTLNAGLRYEYNAPPVDADDRFFSFDFARGGLAQAGTEGFPRAGFDADTNDIAPRVGLAWSPLDGDKLIVRAGYGVFFDAQPVLANSGLYFNPPFFDLRLFFPSEAGLLFFSEPFPTGAGFTPPASLNAIQPDFRTPYMQNWNLSVDRELFGGAVLRVGYVGSKGTKLLRRRDLNQPTPGEGDPQGRRPMPQFANLVTFESGSSSTYHSAQLAVEKRFAAGLGVTAAYTWSKSIDDVSAFLNTDGDPSFPQDSRNYRAERGRSTFDLRHRAVLTTTYQLPFLDNVVLRNWRLHGIGTFQTGRPLTPVLSFDNSNTGNSGGIFGFDRPHLVGEPQLDTPRPEGWWRGDAFTIPEPLTFGNAGRNILTGPGLATVDVAVVRTFKLGDSRSMELRGEAFNLLNRTNFDLPERVVDVPTFGRVSSAGAARQMQIGLRVRF